MVHELDVLLMVLRVMLYRLYSVKESRTFTRLFFNSLHERLAEVQLPDLTLGNIALVFLHAKLIVSWYIEVVVKLLL